MMRKIALVNNFNYGRYLTECIDALLSQTVPPTSVVVVDDGSSDGSQEIIRELVERNKQIIPVFKANGGQLSCFNAARDYVRDQDMVFMLDADDLYPKDYMELMSRHFTKDVAYYFCGTTKFNEQYESPLSSSGISDDAPCLMVSTSALTRRFNCWIGAPTSGNVLTGALYRRIFPYFDEQAWITRADDVFVYGSSILGARKLFLPSLAVSYRVHGENLHHGKTIDKKHILYRKSALERLFGEMCWRVKISSNPIERLVLEEYRSLPRQCKQRFSYRSEYKLRQALLIGRLAQKTKVALGLYR